MATGKNLGKFGRVAFEMCEQIGTHTNRHKANDFTALVVAK